MKRKIKPRSIDEPWSVSMWEPPELINKQVRIKRDVDEHGNEVRQFNFMKVHSMKINNRSCLICDLGHKDGEK